MATYYNLNETQKEMLGKLVLANEQGLLFQPRQIVLHAGDDRYTVWGLQETIDSTADLDELSAAGLLRKVQAGRDPRYQITNAGIDAVANDFRMPESEPGPQVAIGTLINQMTGGTAQGIGYMQGSEARQIVNDPELLKTNLDVVTTALLNEVREALDQQTYERYVAVIEELKDQVMARGPNPSPLRDLLRTAALLGDVEGTIQLMARVWPYIHPLLLMVAMKMAN